MLYEVSIYDEHLKDFAGLHQFSYQALNDPTGDEGFRDNVADIVKRRKIEASEIKIMNTTPEPGELGYRDPNTIDMFSGVQG